MSDFLASLTARSFGTETAIRPRLASLFEPVRNGEAALREAPAVEPIDTAIAREVEVESEGERKRSRPAPAWREDGKASNAKRSEDANSVSPIVSPPRDDSEYPRPTVLADEREKEDTVVGPKVRPRRAPVSQAENANESEPALRSHSEDDTPKRVSTRAAAASAIRDESSENDHRGLVLPPKVFPELTAEMKNAALAMKVGPGTPKREKAGSAWPALAAEPEPSVHVTIGRIEVRATSESKQAGRPRTASPVMSLEEYLHRRTQRGGQ